MKKLILVFVLFCFGGICFGQGMDSSGTDGTVGTKYKYAEPEYYLQKAGKLSQGRVAYSSTTMIAALFALNNIDFYFTAKRVTIILLLFVPSLVIQARISNNIKKAGLAMDERKR